jgi:hypothetical protein
MDGLAIARFLIGMLHDHYRRAEREDAASEKRWRERLEACEQSLPDDDASYTVEQWREFTRLNDETAYAIACHTSNLAILAHLDRLKDALDG